MGASAILALAMVAPTIQGAAAPSRWQKITNQPTFNTDSANLLTDGRVLVHQYNGTQWWLFTPDINGSYLNGTWSFWAM